MRRKPHTGYTLASYEFESHGLTSTAASADASAHAGTSASAYTSTVASVDASAYAGTTPAATA